MSFGQLSHARQGCCCPDCTTGSNAAYVSVCLGSCCLAQARAVCTSGANCGAVSLEVPCLAPRSHVLPYQLFQPVVSSTGVADPKTFAATPDIFAYGEV